MTPTERIDALIERLKFHRRCTDGCLDLIAAVDDAAAALVQLRDSEALARGKIVEQMIEIERLRGANSTLASESICHMDRSDPFFCPKAPCDYCLQYQRQRAERAEARIAELERERDALAKDAERYRWLRLASLSKGDHDYYAKVDRWSVSVENSGFGHSFHADALDAAIDAARKKP